MSNDPEDQHADVPDEVIDTPIEGTDPTVEPGASELDPYDLDGDGKISVIEAERARLGLVDARLEELAEHDGVTGKLAQVAHELLDKLDND